MTIIDENLYQTVSLEQSYSDMVSYVIGYLTDKNEDSATIEAVNESLNSESNLFCRVAEALVSYQAIEVNKVREIGKQNFSAFAKGDQLDHVVSYENIIRQDEETDEQLLGRFNIAPFQIACGTKEYYKFILLTQDRYTAKIDEIDGDEILVRYIPADRSIIQKIVSVELSQPEINDPRFTIYIGSLELFSDDEISYLQNYINDSKDYTDQPTVSQAENVEFDISVKIFTSSLPAPEKIQERVEAAVSEWKEKINVVGKMPSIKLLNALLYTAVGDDQYEIGDIHIDQIMISQMPVCRDASIQVIIV